MIRVKRTFTISTEPLNKGQHVIGNQIFVDGKMSYEGTVSEVESLTNYYTTYYGATYADEGKKNANAVQEDRKNASGKSDVPSGNAGSSTVADSSKK